MIRLRYIVPAVLLAGCTNLVATDWGEVGKGGDDDTGSTDTDTGDTDTDDTDTGCDTAVDPCETGMIDSASSFDDPGDNVGYDAGSDVAEIDITDASGDANTGQEFYLIAVNASEEADASYTVRYLQTDEVEADTGDDGGIDSGDGGGGGGMGPPAPAKKKLKLTPPHLMNDVLKSRLAQPPMRPVLEDADIGTRTDTFRVREELSSEDYATKDATLWALGTYVAIWVDNETPIDWDYECDGIIDEEHIYDSYGFDNCDLSTIADIVDLNIVPNVISLYGSASDIDGDGRIDVFITPELNAITKTSSDEDDFESVLASYAEPAVDLNDFDERANPGSDEREVIYMFAPDPYGIANNYAATSIAAYTGYEVLAEIARSFTTLVSYNQHVLENEGTVEEDWMNDVLGTFAADYCGFGAAYYEEAWDYLDAPYLEPLLAEGTQGSLEGLTRGAQYLFGLWLWDYAIATNGGDAGSIFSAMVQTSDTSTDAVVGAFSGMDFTELVILWQQALLTTGVTTTDGSEMIAANEEYAPYADASMIESIPADRDNHYGANGYQRSFTIRGDNYPYSYGHTDSPTREDDLRVRTHAQDVFMYNPAFEFNGYISKNYGAQIVRLTAVPYDSATVQIQATQGSVAGKLIRWNDPDPVDYAVENVYSALEPNEVELPTLSSDGSAVHGLGFLTDVAEIDIETADGSETGEVADTDRWLLDLSDRGTTETIRLLITLHRYYDSDDSPAPDDPWVAIAPEEFVPEVSIGGTERDETCGSGIEFEYPDSVIEYLYYQAFPSSTMYAISDEDDDPCGETYSGATTCGDDWDGDGVLDDDEPLPETFYGQTLVMQCTLNGGVKPETLFSTDYLDEDELDEDDDFSLSRYDDFGGRSGEDGEEGYLDVEVMGGVRYLVMVGASSGTGAYELVVRQVE